MKKLQLLCTEQDRESLRPILEALEQKGVRISESGGGVTLCALSEAFYADKTCVDALLALVAKGQDGVLPLQLDDAPIPEKIKNALYARNIIPAEGREPELLAERIAAALPQKKSRLPWLFGIAGIALLALIGLLLWRGGRNTEPEALPVMADAELLAAVPAGLSAEELSEVRCVVIVGEHFSCFSEADRLSRADGEDGWPDMLYELASLKPYAQGVDWFWHEDGSVVTEADYDLRFLSLMPNLEELHICMANITATPDLSALPNFRVAWLENTRMPDLEWLADSGITRVYIECNEVDLSPLGRCPSLQRVYFGLHSNLSSGLAAFSPPELRELVIFCGFSPDGFDDMDLSGLAACSALEKLVIQGGNVPDLSFLEGKESLHWLELDGLWELRDISGVGKLKALGNLAIRYCRDLTDYTPIAGCEALYSLEIRGDENPDALRDASFLRDLPELIDVGLYSCNLRNLDFLEGLADNGAPIRLAISGDILDYSGLAHVREYEYLNVNPRYQNGPRGGDFAVVQPYIRDARISRLNLMNCRNVELGELPDGVEYLWINGGDLENLQGLKPYALRELELRDCQYLRSLDGIENIPTLSREGELELCVTGCPRLTDWSALSGAFLEHLKLVGVYAIPKLPAMRFHVLTLESIEGLTDLSFLVGLNDRRDYILRLVGLEELTDLSPLYALYGEELVVPPQVAEQAADLVKAGNYRKYMVEYPNSGWQPQNGPVELLSLEELSTLPAAMLRRVESVTLAGDTVIDTSRYELFDDWEELDGDGRPRVRLRDRETGEEQSVEQGSLTDLRALSVLTGLKLLTVCAQPLESLDGAQELSELEGLDLRSCYALSDASAAFACQQLRTLKMDFCAVGSIQGVQNLDGLRELRLFHTPVGDLTPLLSLPELRSVTVSADMEAAIESLGGQERAFEIDVQG